MTGFKVTRVPEGLERLIMRPEDLMVDNPAGFDPGFAHRAKPGDFDLGRYRFRRCRVCGTGVYERGADSWHHYTGDGMDTVWEVHEG